MLHLNSNRIENTGTESLGEALKTNTVSET